MTFPTSTHAPATGAASQPSNWQMPQRLYTAFSTIYTGVNNVWHATHEFVAGGSNLAPPPAQMDAIPPNLPSSSERTTKRKRVQNTCSPVPTVTSLRRSKRLTNAAFQRYNIPEKPIFRHRRLEREGATTDMEEGDRHPHRWIRQGGLRREESFVLVDHGDHFRMVKPIYAAMHYERLPTNFISIAPFHAFGQSAGHDVLRQALHTTLVDPATPNPNPEQPARSNSKKRGRFEDDDDTQDDRPSKRARRS